MKRFYILLTAGLALAVVAVCYSDSHEIKKDSIQVVDQGIAEFAITVQQAIDNTMELPVCLTVYNPDLGSPASNHIMVSEELTDVFEMRIRPPPGKVQKSERKIQLT